MRRTTSNPYVAPMTTHSKLLRRTATVLLASVTLAIGVASVPSQAAPKKPAKKTVGSTKKTTTKPAAVAVPKKSSEPDTAAWRDEFCDGVVVLKRTLTVLPDPTTGGSFNEYLDAVRLHYFNAIQVMRATAHLKVLQSLTKSLALAEFDAQMAANPDLKRPDEIFQETVELSTPSFEIATMVDAYVDTRCGFSFLLYDDYENAEVSIYGPNTDVAADKARVAGYQKFLPLFPPMPPAGKYPLKPATAPAASPTTTPAP
jgi:hypothetical protein